MEPSYYITLEIHDPKGAIPNNPKLPLLLYQRVFTHYDNPESKFREQFEQNHWGSSWTNGVYDYHHYHSNAHEVLGVHSGSATLIFGGPEGREVEVSRGDMVVIPAGVGHCCLKASDDFKVIGAYPQGQENYDICTEKDEPGEKKKNIARVPLPQADPTGGKNGPLIQEWKQ